MLKITVVDTRGRRKLVVEGKLAAPWTKELQDAWSQARKDLDGRKPIIDLNQVTFISREGEQAIVDLIRQGAKFSCHGVLTKYVLRELARRRQRQA